jgi:O-antigen/teichoic acid export membrane protein
MLRKLVSDTAVYGTSSMLARGLYYLLTLVFGRIFLPEDFGVFTELYAYAGLLNVVLTHGMETAYFRFYTKEIELKEQVFGTSIVSVATISILFLGLCYLFIEPISYALNYAQNQNYLIWFAWIIALDNWSALPFAKLRMEGKAKLFALLKISNVVIMIFFNLLFLFWLPPMVQKYAVLELIYSQKIGIGYVFISNLIASAVTFALLLKSTSPRVITFHFGLYKQMLNYALPLLFIGLAGIANELFDRLMLRRLLPFDDAENLRLLGIYGYCYKLSILMALFTQAFRFAAEPLFFKESKKENAPQIYAKVTLYFTIAGSFIFLGVSLFADNILSFVNEAYLEGLAAIPILLMANLFLGIYFNVSTWYKITDKTHIGAFISFFGAALTIILNIIFIPKFGFMASAWITLVCYFSMTIIGLFFGQRHYPVPYAYSKIIFYILSAFVLVYFHQNLLSVWLSESWLIFCKFLLVTLYLGGVILSEKSNFRSLKQFIKI